METLVGKKAPYFEVDAAIGQDFKKLTLNDYKGKYVCLFFYPLDFTFVCPTELKAFGDKENEFREHGCQLIACSTDSEFSHKAWFERDLPNVKYPVLADTAHAISRDYAVLLEDK